MVDRTGPASLWGEFLGAPVRYVDAGGIRTRVIEPGDGPLLILLHSGGGHAEAYACNPIALAERSLRVIALDFLEHRLTEYPADAVGGDEYVAHLTAAMDALGVENATPTGESLSDGVAFWAAPRHPERVEKLVSVCGARREVAHDPDSQAHVDDGRARFKALNEGFSADISQWRVTLCSKLPRGRTRRTSVMPCQDRNIATGGTRHVEH